MKKMTNRKMTACSLMIITLLYLAASLFVFITRPHTLTDYVIWNYQGQIPEITHVDEEYIEVTEYERVSEKTIRYTVKAIRPTPSCTIELSDAESDYQQLIVLSVDDNLRIINSSNSNFANAHVIILLGIIWLWGCTAVFLLAYLRQRKLCIYSFDSIIYAGFGIFFGSIALLFSLRFLPWLSDRSKLSMSSFYSDLTMTGISYTYFIFPVLLIMTIGLILSNIVLWRKEGRGLVNTVGTLMGILLSGGSVGLLFLYELLPGGYVPSARFMQSLLNGLGAVFLYLECMWLGAAAASSDAAAMKADPDKDNLIILGCGMRADGTPTPLLKGRCDAALSFFRRQLKETGKRARLITSGGQGADEIISEAECMKNYLVSQGVDEADIIQENRSVSTRENFLFSKKLISDANARTAFFTTKYHIFRSGIQAREAGFPSNIQSEGASTKWYFWPNAYVREFIALLAGHPGRNLIFILFLMAVQFSLTMIFFLR